MSRCGLIFKSFVKNRFRYQQLLFRTDLAKTGYMLLAGGVLAAVTAGIPFPVLGIFFGQLVDDFDSEGCKSDGSTEDAALSSKIMQKVLTMIYISRYFGNLLRQEMAFFDLTPAGEVSSHLTTSIEVIRNGTSEKVGIFISSVAYLVGAFVVAFVQAPKLAAMLTFLIPAYILLVLIGGKYVEKRSNKTSAHLTAAASVVSESLLNLPLVHAFDAADKLEARLATSVDAARGAAVKKGAVAAMQFGCMLFFGYLANALAFWQGSKQVAYTDSNTGGEVSGGDVYTVIFVILDASFVLSQIAPFLQMFGSATAAFATLREVAKRQSLIDCMVDQTCKDNRERYGHLEFREVSFTYPSRPEIEVLQGACLKIRAGNFTAIVGSSGSGKSTMASLVLRLYDPNVGSILIDDKELSKMNVRKWRSRISTVDQTTVLFGCTILENIAMGLNAADRMSSSNLVEQVKAGKTPQGPLVSVWARIQRAARQAEAHDFIQGLSKGYATALGPGGTNLSGGQRQRIALARAIVKDPSILLLDEATSALDAIVESKILENLRQTRRGKTTIAIAHRLTTIQDADNIVVFCKGRVIEEGSHTDLIARNGVYSSMFKMQALQTPRTLSLDLTSSQTTSMSKDLEKPRRMSIQSGSRRRSHSILSIAHQKTSLFFAPFPMLRNYTPILYWVSLGFVGAIIAGGSFSADAVIFGHTIGHLHPCQSQSLIESTGNLAGLLFFILALVTLLANALAGSAFGRAAEDTMARVRILTFRSLMKKSLSWHLSADRTPYVLSSHFSKDTAALAGLSGIVLGTSITVLTNLIASILLAHILAWKIAIVLLSTLPIVLGSGFMRLRAIAKLDARHRRLYAESASLTLEATHSIRTIASFGLEDTIFERSRHSLLQPYKESINQIAYTSFWLALAYSVSTLIYALAYWWGSQLIAREIYSQTHFFIVLSALLFSAQSCGQMLALAPDVSSAKEAALRLSKICIMSDNTDEKSVHVRRAACRSQRGGVRIKLEKVHFRHPDRPSTPILRGVNLEIRSGQLCALVGLSGAGKSTIFSVLERFYDVEKGKVEIDGQDIAHLDIGTYRSDIAYVSQESVLFEGTIRYNVGLGSRPGHVASDSQINWACQLAGIHEFVLSLPDGYETQCGDRLSGGQKQRLCIARALVRRPRLLLLDEPTSSLDIESEVRFLEAIRQI